MCVNKSNIKYYFKLNNLQFKNNLVSSKCIGNLNKEIK